MGNKNSKSNVKRRKKILTYSGVGAAVLGITATALSFAVKPQTEGKKENVKDDPNAITTIDNLTNEELKTRFLQKAGESVNRGIRLENVKAEATVPLRTKFGALEDAYWKQDSAGKWVEVPSSEAVETAEKLKEGYTKVNAQYFKKGVGDELIPATKTDACETQEVLHEGYVNAAAWGKVNHTVTIGDGTVDLKLNGGFESAVLDFNLPISYNGSNVITMKAQYAGETIGYGFEHNIDGEEYLDFNWWSSLEAGASQTITDPDGEEREVTNPSDLANLLNSLVNAMAEYGTLKSGMFKELQGVAKQGKSDFAAIQEKLKEQAGEGEEAGSIETETPQVDDKQKLDFKSILGGFKDMTVNVDDHSGDATYLIKLPFKHVGEENPFTTINMELVSDKQFNLKSGKIFTDGDESRKLDLTPLGFNGATLELGFDCNINGYEPSATTHEQVIAGKRQMSKSEDLLLDLYKLTQSPKFKVSMEADVKHYYNTNTWDNIVASGGDAEKQKYERAKFTVESLIDYSNRQHLYELAKGGKVLSLDKLPKALQTNIKAQTYKLGEDGSATDVLNEKAGQDIKLTLATKGDSKLMSYINYNDVMKYKMDLGVLKGLLGKKKAEATKKAQSIISLPEKQEILEMISILKGKGVYRTVEWLINDLWDNVIKGTESVETALGKLAKEGTIPVEFLKMIEGKNTEDNKLQIKLNLEPIGLTGTYFNINLHKDTDTTGKIMKCIDIDGKMKLGGFEITPTISFDCEDKLGTGESLFKDIKAPEDYYEVDGIKGAVDQILGMAKSKEVGADVTATMSQVQEGGFIEKDSNLKFTCGTDIKADQAFNFSNFNTKVAMFGDLTTDLTIGKYKDKPLHMGWKFGAYAHPLRTDTGDKDEKGKPIYAFTDQSKVAAELQTLKYNKEQSKYEEYNDNKEGGDPYSNKLKVDLGLQNTKGLLSALKLLLGVKNDGRLFNVFAEQTGAEQAVEVVTDTLIKQVVNGNQFNGLIDAAFLKMFKTTTENKVATTTVVIDASQFGIGGLGELTFKIISNDDKESEKHGAIQKFVMSTDVDLNKLNATVGKYAGKQRIEFALKLREYSSTKMETAEKIKTEDSVIKLSEIEAFAKLGLNSILFGTEEYAVKNSKGEFELRKLDGDAGDWTTHVGTERTIKIEFPELTIGSDKLMFKEDKPALTIRSALTPAEGLRIKTDIHVPFIPGLNNRLEKGDASIGEGIDTQIFYQSCRDRDDADMKDKNGKDRKFDLGTLYLKRVLGYTQGNVVDYRKVQMQDFLDNFMDWGKYYIANIYDMLPEPGEGGEETIKTQEELTNAQIEKANATYLAAKQAYDSGEPQLKDKIIGGIIGKAFDYAPQFRIENVIDQNTFTYETNTIEGGKAEEVFTTNVNMNSVLDLFGEKIPAIKNYRTALPDANNNVALVVKGETIDGKAQHITQIGAKGEFNFVVGVKFNANINIEGGKYVAETSELQKAWGQRVTYINNNCDFSPRPYEVKEELMTDSFYYDKDGKVALVWAYKKLDESGKVTNERVVIDQAVYGENGEINFQTPTGEVVSGLSEAEKKSLYITPAVTGDTILEEKVDETTTEGTTEQVAKYKQISMELPTGVTSNTNPNTTYIYSYTNSRDGLIFEKDTKTWKSVS